MYYHDSNCLCSYCSEYWNGRADYWQGVWDPPSYLSYYRADYEDGWFDSEYLDYEWYYPGYGWDGCF